MQTRDFIRTLRRRWYLVLATVIVAVGATAFVVIRMGPTYEATGSALVLPPLTTVERDAEVQAVGNPLLSLGGVSQARDLVIQQLVSQSAQDEIAIAYPGAEYQVTQDFTNSAPVILVTMEAPSAEAASAALQAVIARVPVALATLQSGFQLPADASITSTPLIVDTQPQVLHKDQIRTGIVVAIAVLGIGLLAIGLLDGLLLGRRAAPIRTTTANSGHGHEWPVSSSRQLRKAFVGSAPAPPWLPPRGKSVNDRHRWTRPRAPADSGPFRPKVRTSSRTVQRT
ncbi:MAG TPA: hypothetical protein PKY70_05120 [Nakamurella multipartita]|nr:hypothetical protein [Nakamurella multipartita]